VTVVRCCTGAAVGRDRLKVNNEVQIACGSRGGWQMAEERQGGPEGCLPCGWLREAFLKLFSSGDHCHQSECSADHFY
jgi:hypothetical protein